MADWRGFNETMAKVRAEQPPAVQAMWDQAVAALETSGREHGVDLTDPDQARAAVLGASMLFNTLKAEPLWALVGQWLDEPGLKCLALFVSFIPKEPV